VSTLKLIIRPTFCNCAIFFYLPKINAKKHIGLGTHLFVWKISCPQRDLFSIRVKLPPVTISLTTLT